MEFIVPQNVIVISALAICVFLLYFFFTNPGEETAEGAVRRPGPPTIKQKTSGMLLNAARFSGLFRHSHALGSTLVADKKIEPEGKVLTEGQAAAETQKWYNGRQY